MAFGSAGCFRVQARLFRNEWLVLSPQALVMDVLSLHEELAVFRRTAMREVDQGPFVQAFGVISSML